MEEYQSNSNNSKNAPEPERHVESVVNGGARFEKKSGARKFADAFVPEDISSAKSYVLMDVLLPAVKNVVWEVFTKGLKALLYGENDHAHNASQNDNYIHASYQNYYDARNRQAQNPIGSLYRFQNVEYNDRGEAEAVLSNMRAIIAQYGSATVNDLYDLSGITGNFTDASYGWSDLRGADTTRTSSGRYIIRFPKVLPLRH